MTQAQNTLGQVTFQNEHPTLGDSRAEIIRGLRKPQKVINPKYFYDETGSQLFDQITRLPEYYPTRTEMGILSRHSEDIGEVCGKGCLLIEPGSGSCEKARLLLDSLRPSVYVPVDISAEYLQKAAEQLGKEYPWLRVHAVCADFNDGWQFIEDLPEGKRVVFYPGSTIGNLEPEAAEAFLAQVKALVGACGGALVGVDLHKSEDRLNAAYNDSRGITADFNKNILSRVNALLDADFEHAQFDHHAFYDSDKQRIEMHLVSRQAQQVKCNGSTIELHEGETIHTENSYKYTLESFSQLASRAGLELQKSWLDDEALFSVHYLAAPTA